MSLPLALARFLRFSAIAGVHIDDTFGQAAADGDFIHIDIRRVEEAAMLAHRHHGERVRARMGTQCGALQRVERNINLRAFARTHFFTDIQASVLCRARPRQSHRAINR